MMIPVEFLTIAVTLFLVVVGWIFQAGQLKQQIYRDLDKIAGKITLLTAKDDGNSEIDSLRFQNLQDKVDKSTLIIEAKHQSLTNELYSRLEQIDGRLDDVEAFLMKSTEFVRRKNIK